MGQAAVVREKEQARGVFVQPPHREDSFLCILSQQGDHGVLRPVRGGRYHADGFVHHIVDELFIAQRLPPESNLVRQLIHLPVRAFRQGAVYRHKPLAHIGLYLASGAQIHFA